MDSARLAAKSACTSSFGEGGCLTDLDGDGVQEFVGKEGPGLGKLTWRNLPIGSRSSSTMNSRLTIAWKRHCSGAKEFSSSSAICRFGFTNEAEGKRWPYREIYSIYTPSQQTGLSMRDIDSDGHVDIVCGNYWIKSPQSFELPWHIFAINTYSELPESAMLTHAFAGKDLVVAQGHMSDARVTLFTKPEDPRQLWPETRIKGRFHRVHAIAVGTECCSSARTMARARDIFALRNRDAAEIAKGIENLQIMATKDGMISVGPHELVSWRYDRRK